MCAEFNYLSNAALHDFLSLFVKKLERYKQTFWVFKLGEKMAKNVWGQPSPDYLEKLYESMPRIMQAVVDAQEGHTKY